jgi:hypothetical protein
LIRLDASEALRALGIHPEPGLDLSFEQDIKRAYRRIAMELHPDRHQAKSPEHIACMEERFKHAKLAYETLSAWRESGDWPPVLPSNATDAAYRFAAFPPNNMSRTTRAPGSGAAGTRDEPSSHGPADPATRWAGLVCDLLARAASQHGAERSRLLGAIASKMAPRAPLAIPLDRAFLLAFWSRVEPGIFGALDELRALWSGQGDGHLASICHPHRSHCGCAGSEGFGLLSHLAQRAPRRLGSRDQLYYQEAFSLSAPLAKCGSTESAEPLSNRLATPFFAQLLERSPDLAEWLAPRLAGDDLPPSDWVRLCVGSHACAASLAHLLNGFPIDQILKEADQAGPDISRAWMLALSARAWSERRIDLGARPGASESLALRFKAHQSLQATRSDCDALGSHQPERRYAPEQSYARLALARALEADPEHALYILERAPELEPALSHRGWPLCAACAARALFEPSSRTAMLESIQALARVLGSQLLSAPDPFGLCARDWLDAINAEAA